MSNFPTSLDQVSAAGYIGGTPREGGSRPFGPNARWNILAAGFTNPANPDYSSLLWSKGSNKTGSFTISFTYPVYEADNNTPRYKPVVANTQSTLANLAIPFDPGWTLTPNNRIIILDTMYLAEYDLSNVSFVANTLRMADGCLATNAYLTYEGGSPGSRGCGIEYLAMLVRPQEIQQGIIPHALSMRIVNTLGNTYITPATTLDPRANTVGGIPEGVRFHLTNLADTDITNWASNLPLSDQGKASAVVIATALRDYGWYITDTANSAFFDFENVVTANPTWDSLGLGSQTINGVVYPDHLLDGLMLSGRITAFTPSSYDIHTPTSPIPSQPPPTAPPLPPSPPAVGTTILGLCADGNQGAGKENAAVSFSNWLGKPVGLITDFMAQGTWGDFQGDGVWAPGVAHAANSHRQYSWAIPLSCSDGKSLSSVASGAHDGTFNAVASAIAQNQPGAVIRIGWEFNGNWFCWSPSNSGGAGTPAQYAAAFQHVVRLFRAKSPNFKFDWCMNFSLTGGQPLPEASYPGDDYVDIIGMDTYDWTGSSDFTSHVINANHGLGWLANFAASHNKPMSLPEWGAGNYGDNPAFIQGIHDWIVSHNVYYHSYWDTQSAYPGKISGGQHPKQAAKYKALFG